jgi:hypothetical protein
MVYPKDSTQDIACNSLDSWLGAFISEFEVMSIIARINAFLALLYDFLNISYSIRQRLIMTSIDEKTPLVREASSLCQTLSLFARQLLKCSNHMNSKEHLEQLIAWLRNFCADREIDDSNLAKNFVSLLIRLEKDIGNFNTATEFAQDVLIVRGEIDADVCKSNDETQKYAIVNERTVGHVCNVLITFLMETMDDIEWCLGRLKGSGTLIG